MSSQWSTRARQGSVAASAGVDGRQQHGAVQDLDFQADNVIHEAAQSRATSSERKQKHRAKLASQLDMSIMAHGGSMSAQAHAAVDVATQKEQDQVLFGVGSQFKGSSA